MPDLLNIASSALLSYQRSLDTIGHNIANVNTPGYSRQRVELAAREGVGSGGGFFGGGVGAISVQRLGDPFSGDRLIGSLAQHGESTVLSTLAVRVDRLLSDDATGLAAPLRDYAAALDGVTADPASIAARETFRSAAESLALRFNQVSTGLEAQAAEIDRRIEAGVSEINGLSGEIAALNDRIVLAQGQGAGQPPNDLLDRRDELVRQLSERIGVSTVMQDDGSLNVFGAGGQPLVLGSTAGTLRVTRDAFESGGVDVLFSAAGVDVRVTRQVEGGALGGLLQARSGLIDPARNEVGRLAAAVGLQANAQQAAGVDLRGQPGQPLFVAPEPGVYPAADNAGAATVAASLVDAGALSGRDLLLRYDGAAWQIVDAASGAPAISSGSGTPGDPYLVDGVQIVLGGGAAVAGDRVLIRPTGEAGAAMSLALTDPAGLAAAAPVGARAAADNGGDAVPALTVADPANPGLATPVTVEFVAANSYTVNGGGPFAYTAGDVISANGWDLSLDGTPATGDSFLITPTPADSSDNSNALGWLGGFAQGIFDGGTTSIQEASAQLLTRVGASAQRAELQQLATGAIVEQDRLDLESATGVNLDEEAADLLRYEQAYQAAARVIATADSLFQTLLNAVGRA